MEPDVFEQVVHDTLEALPEWVLERLGTAPERGVVAAHLAGRRLALLVDACAPPDPHLAYVAEWSSGSAPGRV